MVKLLRVALPVTLFCIIACASGEDYTIDTLPNGEEIKVIGVSKLLTPDSSVLLVLNYESDLDIADTAALGEEVAGVWPYFQATVEEAGLQKAVIKAHNTTRENRFMSSSKTYGFVFEKQENGDWVSSDSK